MFWDTQETDADGRVELWCDNEHTWKAKLTDHRDGRQVGSGGSLHNLAIARRLAKERSYFVSAHHISMAVMLLSWAPKSTEVEDLQTLTLEAIKAGERRPILEEHRDAHTKAGKDAGRNWSDWYSDRHRVLGVPVNPYTEELWRVKPEWHPDRVTGKKAAN